MRVGLVGILQKYIFCALLLSLAAITHADFFTLNQLFTSKTSVQPFNQKFRYSNFTLEEVTGSISRDMTEYTVAESYKNISFIFGSNTTSIGTLIFTFDVTAQPGYAKSITSTRLTLHQDIPTAGLKMLVVTEMLDPVARKRLTRTDGSGIFNYVEHSKTNPQYSDFESWQMPHSRMTVRMIVQFLPANAGFTAGPYLPTPGSFSLFAICTILLLKRVRC